MTARNIQVDDEQEFYAALEDVRAFDAIHIAYYRVHGKGFYVFSPPGVCCRDAIYRYIPAGEVAVLGDPVSIGRVKDLLDKYDPESQVVVVFDRGDKSWISRMGYE